MERSIRLGENKKETLAGAALALAIAVVFSLIFYTCNTPLGPAVGSDNAMYLTMGTALAKGYAPYSEIFDHKGPLLFILQMIPQLFTGGYSTLAVFVQEVMFLWACLLVLACMARKLDVPALLVQIIYLAVYAPLTDGANLTEEYAIDPETFVSKGHATPFAGWKVFGRCLKTVCGGKTVFEKK